MGKPPELTALFVSPLVLVRTHRPPSILDSVATTEIRNTEHVVERRVRQVLS